MDAHTWHERSLPASDGAVVVVSRRRLHPSGEMTIRRARVECHDLEQLEEHLTVVEDCHDIDMRKQLGA